jgi:hypothetical protein
VRFARRKGLIMIMMIMVIMMVMVIMVMQMVIMVMVMVTMTMFIVFLGKCVEAVGVLADGKRVPFLLALMDELPSVVRDVFQTWMQESMATRNK